MKTKEIKLSSTRICRIREQGYFNQTDEDIKALAFGNRFAFRLCGSILLLGLVFSNIPILATMMLIAFFGVVLPYHPFDYIYNHILSKRLNKPRLPRRSPQLKFACGLATAWIGGIIILFHNYLMIEGFIFGSLLIVVAFLVSGIDYCIPSKIYNAIFLKNRIQIN
jgi:hypothetical protein